MSNFYSNIADFLDCRKVCFFCGEPLCYRVTQFLGSFNELPVVSAPIKDDTVDFSFQHTTAIFDLQVKARINVNTNVLTFSVPENSDTPSIDNMLAKNVFLSLFPHVQLYCKCKYSYTVVSEAFQVVEPESKKYVTELESTEYVIKPLELFYESFVMGSLWIQNDYIWEKTNIYTRDNEGALPITYPLLDWNAMGQKKLLTRIKTLVVWS